MKRSLLPRAAFFAFVLVLVSAFVFTLTSGSAHAGYNPDPTDFDLDVNADGDLADPVDRVARYLPGCEGNTPKIQWDAAGKFVAPQEMKLVVTWNPATTSYDEVIFRISETTIYLGFCMNSAMDHGDHDDYSFKKEDDARGPIAGTLTSGKATVPFFCSDFGGDCKVTVECKKGGTVIYTGTLQIPKDANGNRIADLWSGDSWNGTFPLYDGEEVDGVPSLGDGLTRFEEYRGVLRNNQFARMSPILKELFIYRENSKYGVGDGPGTLAWIEDVRADEINGAKHDDKQGIRCVSKKPRIVNFWGGGEDGTPIPHKVDQHGLWVAVLDDWHFPLEEWGERFDNMGGSTGDIGPPETAGRVVVWASNIKSFCGPVKGDDFSWDASARLSDFIGDTTSHELGHGVSMEHQGDLPDLWCFGYPADWDGTDVLGGVGGMGGFVHRVAEAGPANAYMRYRYSEMQAAIAGDLNMNGVTTDPDEAPDTDWTPTVTDATEYGEKSLKECVIDDSDE